MDERSSVRDGQTQRCGSEMGGKEGEDGQDWDISGKNKLGKTAKHENCEDLQIEDENHYALKCVIWTVTAFNSPSCMFITLSTFVFSRQNVIQVWNNTMITMMNFHFG